MTYKSQQHKTIFEKAVKKKDKSNRVLIAAMYLLTADNKLWQIMQHHIEQNQIDFDGVKLNAITENAYTLYCAAKDMYFNTDFLSIVILHYLMENPVQGESIEFNDNRLALYCAQQGKCAISGKPLVIGDIHCHHKTRKADGGNDRYTNLVLVCKDVHILLHATREDTIEIYKQRLSLNCKQMDKLNRLRRRLNLNSI